MPPLVLLAASLGWNYARSRHGKSTMCSATRPYVKPALAVGLWVGLTRWFIPHYCEWVLPQFFRLPSLRPTERSK